MDRQWLILACGYGADILYSCEVVIANLGARCSAGDVVIGLQLRIDV
jgi:hypothetical protein